MALHQLPLYEGVITRRLLKQLGEVHRPGELLLSVYLDMDPSRWGDAEGIRIAAKNSLRQLHEKIGQLPISNGERQRLLRETELIQELATLSAGRRGLRGLACFLASPVNLAYALPLPWPVHFRYFLEDRFVLWPLHQVLDQSDLFGMVLVDKDEARLYLGYLGQVEEMSYIFDEIPPKIRIPDAFGELQFRRKHVEYFHHHFDRVAYNALRLWEQEPFRYLIVGGLWEILPQFESHLHRYLRERIIARWEISVHAAKTELQKRLEQEESQLLQRQAEQVWRELNEAPPERQAKGPERVFRALWEQRVGHLLVQPNTRYHGHVCTQCQRLHLSGGPCIECGGSVNHVPDIYEEAVRVALSQSAHVRYWNSPALEECDGIAALLRY
jgi:peptide subunit release factor 1 (eRF1)